jgi:micrococcal nuclease
VQKINNKTIATGVVFFSLVFLPAMLQAGDWYRVKAVIDGDTILLQDGRFVRYIGINAPEIAHADKKGEPFGDPSTRYNSRLVRSGRVRLEFDRQKYDRYDRLLAYVYNESGVMINRAMIESGMASCLYKAPNIRYEKELLEAQMGAMNASKGIWKLLGRAGGIVIGNKRSKRFHRVDCRNAKKMSKKNRVRISTQWQAFKRGYSPGKNCLGGMPVP